MMKIYAYDDINADIYIRSPLRLRKVLTYTVTVYMP